MARAGGGERTTKRRAPTTRDRRPLKKRVCIFCTERIDWVDYKDVNMLRRFMSERAKIRARRVTGNCSRHQREVAVAIKTSREMALLPYAIRQVTQKGGRGERGAGGMGRGRDRDRERPLSLEDFPGAIIDGEADARSTYEEASYLESDLGTANAYDEVDAGLVAQEVENPMEISAVVTDEEVAQ